jgi:hypothetical protein
MRFAFFTHVPWPEGTDPQRIIAQTTAQVQYAEELGFCSRIRRLPSAAYGVRVLLD